jgi:hypothetical protein
MEESQDSGRMSPDRGDDDTKPSTDVVTSQNHTQELSYLGQASVTGSTPQVPGYGALGNVHVDQQMLALMYYRSALMMTASQQIRINQQVQNENQTKVKTKTTVGKLRTTSSTRREKLSVCDKLCVPCETGTGPCLDGYHGNCKVRVLPTSAV